MSEQSVASVDRAVTAGELRECLSRVPPETPVFIGEGWKRFPLREAKLDPLDPLYDPELHSAEELCHRRMLWGLRKLPAVFLLHADSPGASSEPQVSVPARVEVEVPLRRDMLVVEVPGDIPRRRQVRLADAVALCEFSAPPLVAPLQAVSPEFVDVYQDYQYRFQLPHAQAVAELAAARCVDRRPPVGAESTKESGG